MWRGRGEGGSEANDPITIDDYDYGSNAKGYSALYPNIIR